MAENAQWFAETYGLSPQSLSLEDTTGHLINVTLKVKNLIKSIVCSEGSHDMSSEKNTSQPNKPYDNLDEEEKENIRALLFIMDRFSISLEGYHELTQVENSLPMTYLTESCTKVLDSKWEVTRTLGDAPGAELPSKLLLEHEVRQHLKNIELPVQTMKVKISGDGTRMSHSSNVFVCSFAIVENGQNYLSSSGNHTIAIIKGKEEQQTLKA
ncbi:hypothetical protein AWC38_SpisGene20160 [Stylophora pistillata]|uniref:Uncharacterized protein n=2 Tax=Stylophora pistillata TaxID=50429 RepID=A0A2B4RH84_STYPI|nr:hypothetical protein AWC38_SpisGene20160 [Stylophora pistillata]